MTSFEIQLEELLKKDQATLINTQKEAFKQLTAKTGERYVLFGSGRLGQITLAGLRKSGIEPLAFADNNSKLWGAKVNGLQVLSPSLPQSNSAHQCNLCHHSLHQCSGVGAIDRHGAESSFFCFSGMAISRSTHAAWRCCPSR
jgi:hypothetical protein